MKKIKHLIKASLFLRFALIVVIVAFVSLFISLGIYRENMKKLLITEVENKAAIYLSGLEGAVRQMVTGREPVIQLNELLDIKAGILKEYLTFNIIRLAVLSPEGHILDHTVADRIGKTHMNEDFKAALASDRPTVIHENKVLRFEPDSPELSVIKIYYPVRQHNKYLMAMIMMDVDVRRTMETVRAEYARLNRRVIFGFALTTVLMAVCILFSLRKRIIGPVAAVVHASGRIARGHLDLLPVPKGRDEIVALVKSFNHMVEGLIQRDQMRLSLELAREVQQNLLPGADPVVDGLDIAGRSIYCDSTGGDYYDYLYADNPSGVQRVLVVVGDVSDHGIQSALLMATARATLHQSWMRTESLVNLLSDVNLQLAVDVEDSGYFMTMFLAQIDSKGRWIQWANAGHEPALVYNGDADAFEELTGRGLALGIDGGIAYTQWQRDISPGQLFVIGTDGIWEARGPNGDVYGKNRLKAVVRHNAAAPAREIVKAIINDVETFVSQPLEDDITITIIKV